MTQQNMVYLFDAHQFWIIIDDKDAADDGPADEMHSEAEQREPDAPGGLTY